MNIYPCETNLVISDTYFIYNTDGLLLFVFIDKRSTRYQNDDLGDIKCCNTYLVIFFFLNLIFNF